jgi:peptidoglycan/xylan/chitin deacetylase (PgdA/CDA1 family)
MIKLQSNVPCISFSFDDAPRTAFNQGGKILKAYGTQGTYFVSLGLLGLESPSGMLASPDDLYRAVEEGHELGCHTFDHQNSWTSQSEIFVQSVLKNKETLAKILPTATFTTFAYPLCGPRPAIKQRIGKMFSCCRGGGQAGNLRSVDLNLLNAYFLDYRNRNEMTSIKWLIDRNTKYKGWLIFATHDVADEPSSYGCTIDLFDKVVAYAISSGAAVLPVNRACEKIISRS